MKTSKIFAVVAAFAIIIGAGEVARAERGDMSPRLDSKRDVQNVLLQKKDSKRDMFRADSKKRDMFRADSKKRDMFRVDSKREMARSQDKIHIAKLSTKGHKAAPAYLALGSKSLKYRG